MLGCMGRGTESGADARSTRAERPAEQTGPQLARLAALLADETRARFCVALLDGRAWTAGELARSAGVSAATASSHLDKLTHGGLLAEQRVGRHRYVRLAGPRLAQLLEEMLAHTEPPPPPRTLRASSVSSAMARARTCYDHLAGRLGVAVTDGLLDKGLVQGSTGFAVTGAGMEWFRRELGVDLASGGRRRSRRAVARVCIDMTERRPHLAGLAGAELCAHALDSGWCERIGTARALRVTGRGRDALRDLLGIELEETTET